MTISLSYAAFIQRGGSAGTLRRHGQQHPAGSLLNYYVFDKNLNFEYGGFKKTVNGNQGTMKQFTTDIPIKIEKPGYILVYLSNESNAAQRVFFDELTVSLTRPIIQADDYYPFGMTMVETSYQNPVEKENRYLYQGKEMQDDLGLDIFDFEWRMYDPAIVRTFQIDPHSENYYSISPYSFLSNNPLLFVDPNGMDNIIYLIMAGDFDKKEAQAIIEQANAAFKELGLETRVSLYDSEASGAFDASNLDDTDNWAIIGEDRNAIIETAKDINPEWANYLEDGTKPWSKGNHPETSNNARHGDGGYSGVY